VESGKQKTGKRKNGKPEKRKNGTTREYINEKFQNVEAPKKK
jgi:hypothetical protein